MSSSVKKIILNTAQAGLFLLFAAEPPRALAAVPELINFQGKLADSGGKAVTSTVPIVFKLYAAAAGGSPV